MGNNQAVGVELLEPLEVTSWVRRIEQELEAKKPAPSGRGFKKKSQPKAGRGTHRSKVNGGKRRPKRPTSPKPKVRREAPWPEAASTVGVYGLYHRPTHSIYVGYTADKNGFKWRWKRHKAQLFVAKAHHCKPLQKFVNSKRLKPEDFELVILSSYPARPRTQKLCDLIVKEEVAFWDRASELGFTMLCERPTGARRRYTAVRVKKAKKKQ